MNTFVVYSKDNCPYCEQSKRLIDNMGDKYTENKLGVDFDRDQLLELFPDARSFPIVVKIDEGAQRIGGFDELAKWYKDNIAQEEIKGMSI